MRKKKRFNLEDYEKFTLGVVGLFVLMMAIIVACVATIDYASCKEAGSVMGVDTKYRFVSGCYVDAGDGNYAPVENWIVKDKR